MFEQQKLMKAKEIIVAVINADERSHLRQTVIRRIAHAICKDLHVSMDSVKTDEELASKSLLMRSHRFGVIAAKLAYGRGADLRFAVDSHVVIPF